ncbi:hypothetical protein E1281_08965 [Actinomadura sp. KC345]|uniref:hypothetical protein n=1 Tax=Actinomadura sp. KC345 TaxID=2530371 RepID=UPI00104A5804|nr:hypothetical protein [Actinomadura sp. KC345]TDC56081.1 hypothetical protein E1281_08965 [Actinomadura sp. KC345]
MKHDDSGHEPEQTHDRDFAPVNEDSDARGRTVRRASPATGRSTGSARRPAAGGHGTSGTGTPGVEIEHPDTLPPDEEGVEEAERHDDSRR